MNVALTARWTPTDFLHLDALSDDRGLFEHADHTVFRPEHGYCTDDNARLLVVVSSESDSGTPHRLGRMALGFVLDALDGQGRVRNRMNVEGRWTDTAGTDDCWGRAVWALGVAAARHEDDVVSAAARRGFECATQQRSPWSRSMAFAALGAAEVLAVHPDSSASVALLDAAVATIDPPSSRVTVWPELRLRYANATLAEAMIAAGAGLNRDDVTARGLEMLGWLLDQETIRGHLSVAAVGGRVIGDGSERHPQFDQQPIEAAAMADACWRAFRLTGDVAWARGVRAATGWFLGENDSGQVMRDARSGGCFDGLRVDGVNRNQGAESTLALVSTMQRARSLDLVAS